MANADFKNGTFRQAFEADWSSKLFSYTYHCGHCRTKKALSRKPVVGWSAFWVQALVSSLFVIAVGWQWFGFKGLFLALPVFVVFEWGHRLSMRHLLTCENCGFDPFLYQKDVKRARAKVMKHLEARSRSRVAPGPPPPTVA